MANIINPSTIICPQCGDQTNGMFCERCGAKLIKKCQICGMEQSLSAKFCNECGAPHGTGTSAQADKSKAEWNNSDLVAVRSRIEVGTQTTNSLAITNIYNPIISSQISDLLVGKHFGMSDPGSSLNEKEQSPKRLQDSSIITADQMTPSDGRSRAKKHLNLSQWDDAIAEATAAIKLDARDGISYSYRAIGNLMIGELDHAEADSKDAIQLNPQECEDFIFVQHLVCFMRGMYDGGIAGMAGEYKGPLPANPQKSPVVVSESLKRMFAQTGELIPAYNQCALVHLLTAFLNLVVGKKAVALADGTDAIRLAPRCAIAYFLRAQAWERQDAARALADVSEAVRIAPLFADGYAVRANIYISQRKYERALLDINEALKINPRHLDSISRRAELELIQGNWDAAIESATEVISKYPWFPWVYGTRALAFSEKGDLKAAEIDMREGERLANLIKQVSSDFGGS